MRAPDKLFLLLEQQLRWPQVLLVPLLLGVIGFGVLVGQIHRDLPDFPPGDALYGVRLILQEAIARLAGEQVLTLSNSTDQEWVPCLLPSLAGLWLVGCLMRINRRILLIRLLKVCHETRFVFGEGPIANTLLRNYQTQHGVVIPLATDKQAHAHRLTLLPEELAHLGLTLWARCREIVAIAPNDLDNLAFLQQLFQKLPADAGRPPVLVGIRSTPLKQQLAARMESTAQKYRIPLSIVAINELRAREVLNRYPPDRFRLADRPRHQHLLIIGMGDMGQALLREILRQSAYSHQERIQISLVDHRRHVLQEIRGNELTPVESFFDFHLHSNITEDGRMSIASLLPLIESHPLTSVYLCLEGGARELNAAWHLEERFRSLGLTLPPLVLTASEPFQHEGVQTNPSTEKLVLTGCTGESLIASLLSHLKRLDQGAQLMHEDYVKQCGERGERIGDRDSLHWWPELSEFFKDDNRALSDHLPCKVRDQGMVLVSASRHEEFCQAAEVNAAQSVLRAIPPVPAEALAFAEHQRWWLNRLVKGWHYAPVRNDAQKAHPDMVPWDKLSEPTRDKDRNMITQLPSLARDQALRLCQRLYVAINIETGALKTSRPPRDKSPNLRALALQPSIRKALAAGAFPVLLLAPRSDKQASLCSAIASDLNLPFVLLVRRHQIPVDAMPHSLLDNALQIIESGGDAGMDRFLPALDYSARQSVLAITVIGSETESTSAEWVWEVCDEAG